MDILTLAALQKPATDLALKLLKPLTNKLAQLGEQKASLMYHKIFNSYSKYLEESYSRHMYFSSIVFKNEQKKLDDYYIPLTIVRPSAPDDSYTISDFPTEFISTNERILVVDTAGMGKTTLLKVLFLNCVRQQNGIPIYVELRKLSRKRSLLDFIVDQLSDLDGNQKKDLLFNLIKSGEFIFFLDGYDEIPEVERTEVTADLQDFIRRASKNIFVMTSRDEIGLTSFPSFQRFTINPLKKNEAYALLEKYADGNLAKTLIAKLELPQYSGIHEFLENPLLTSLLYKSFEFKATIPLKKHIFYRQVFEALYEVHDLTKEGGEYNRPKRSGLDIDRFERILRFLGYLTYRAAKIEFSKDDLLEFINSAKKLASESKAQSSRILHDLIHAVPLMNVDGNYVRWSHKSIQEYFAAQYLCRDTQGKLPEILLNYYNNPDIQKHVNLLSICADIDGNAFRHSVIKKIIEDGLASFSSSYNFEYPGISVGHILERKRLSTGRCFFFIRVRFTEDLIHSIDHETINIAVKPVQDYMNQTPEGQLMQMIQIANPGIAIAATTMSNAIDALDGNIDLPFVKGISNLKSQDLSEIDIDKNIHAIKIDDSLDNPVNSENNFLIINNMMSDAAEWKFDEIIAAKILKAINLEIITQRELLNSL
jgi:hypothetical protein